MAQSPAQMRGADDSSYQELCSYSRPEASLVGAFWRYLIMQVFEEAGPACLVLVVGGKGHKDEAYKNKGWRDNG